MNKRDALAKLEEKKFHGIKISASNVVFDCNGYAINGSNASSLINYGIFVEKQLSNVTIKNCNNVHDFSYGIYARGYNIF